MPTDNEYLRLIWNQLQAPSPSPSPSPSPTGVAIANGENHIGEVGGNLGFVSQQFNRPSGSLTYAAGQVVIGSGGLPLEFTDVARKIGRSGYLNSFICSTNMAAMTGQLRLHLFTTSPSQLTADGTPFKMHSDNKSVILGWVDFTMFVSGGAGSNTAESVGTLYPYPMAFRTELASASLYGVVQSVNGWTANTGQNFFFQLFGDRY